MKRIGDKELWNGIFPNEVLTYTDWVLLKGTESELGAKALVTDKILRKLSEAENLIYSKLIDAISNALIKQGKRPKHGEFHIEFDYSMWANEYTAILDTIQGDYPVEYVSMAYNVWQEEKTKRIAWQKKSLWEYIKWCWVRKKLKVI